MEKFTLDTMNIAKIGFDLSKSLHECGVHNGTLIIPLDENRFRKVDEDLFYRNREEGSDEEFIPSDNEIKVEIDNVTIKFEKAKDGIKLK